MSNYVQAYPVDDHITIINKQYENIKKLIHLIHPYFDENRIQNSVIDQEFENIVNQSII